MFDTILIGTSGLLGHAQGLRTIGNNLANVNTPGFKGAQLDFANLVNQESGGRQAGADNRPGRGAGLETLGTRISFQAGMDRATGNPLDLSIDGNGFYTLKRGEQLLYSRAGDFQFDRDGVLTNHSGDRVQGLDGHGKLTDITLDNLQRNMPKATSKVTFSGSLNTATEAPASQTNLNGVTVYDPAGEAVLLNLSFLHKGAGDYALTVTDPAGKTLHVSNVKFTAGFPSPVSSEVTFTHTPASGNPFTLTLDLSQGVTSLAQTSSLAMLAQDGYRAGLPTGQAIGSDGKLTVYYSNGQSATGERIALANFLNADDLEQGSGSTFIARQGVPVRYGFAGSEDFGKLVPGHQEGSNIDMASEFSNLILMQRGYQASSHVISTANDMIQQLFEMKGR